MNVLKVKEACELLQMSQSSVYRRLDEIPHFKVDSMLRFEKERLIEWMKSKEEGDAYDRGNASKVGSKADS